MNKTSFLAKMKDIYEHFLEFLESEEDFSNDYLKFQQYLTNQRIQEKNQGLVEFLQLISEISNEHHQTPEFQRRIEQTLIFLKDAIKQNFTNYSIFNIFQHNKRILLFLSDEKIMSFTKRVYYAMKKNADLNNFFLPEITSFLSEQYQRPKITFPDSFIKDRKDGENSSYICKLIRNDSIQEFNAYVHKNNISLSKTEINNSIFETNQFLMKKKVTLIEYTAFFGSIQIFKYLHMNGVDLTPSLWCYAVHSKNPEIIQILEENHVKTDKDILKLYLLEAIKCHHNDIANYIITKNENLYDSLFIEKNSSLLISYFNFCYFPEKNLSFKSLVRSNYYTLMKIILKTTKIDVNQIIINYKF